jgi:hypothetical protein
VEDLADSSLLLLQSLLENLTVNPHFVHVQTELRIDSQKELAGSRVSLFIILVHVTMVLLIAGQSHNSDQEGLLPPAFLKEHVLIFGTSAVVCW